VDAGDEGALDVEDPDEPELDAPEPTAEPEPEEGAALSPGDDEPAEPCRESVR